MVTIRVSQSYKPLHGHDGDRQQGDSATEIGNETTRSPERTAWRSENLHYQSRGVERVDQQRDQEIATSQRYQHHRWHGPQTWILHISGDEQRIHKQADQR